MKSNTAVAVLLLGFISGATGNSTAQTPDRGDSGGRRRESAAPQRIETPNSFLGGVPSGQATAEVLPLSFQDAVKRGLRYNLGVILSDQSLRSARGARLRALSDLLPNVTTSATERRQQVNLAVFGISAPGFPSVVGPFSVFDARAFLSQPILDFNALNKARAEAENVQAAEYSLQDTRDLVALVCGNLYLQAVAGESRIETARAQMETAQALYTLAVDRKQAGVAAGIDVLRSQVQLQQQQLQLIVAQNEFSKQKLSLARAIGLPIGQEFSLADHLAYSPLPATTETEALERAYGKRADYKSAAARVRAAEAQRKAALAERLPSVDLDAEYGDIGPRPAKSHGTFTVAASLRIPLFQGGRVRGRVMEADAFLHQQQAALEDLRVRIYYEIRTAFLDLKSAEDRVQVANSSVNLAQEQLQQARDRFSAGVASSIELVQAQDAVAIANENYISSLYSFNLAKASLARALGASETAYEEFLRGK